MDDNFKQGDPEPPDNTGTSNIANTGDPEPPDEQDTVAFQQPSGSPGSSSGLTPSKTGDPEPPDDAG
jgi:hypothetical protein